MLKKYITIYLSITYFLDNYNIKNNKNIKNLQIKMKKLLTKNRAFVL